jgi:hypothetical protein
MKAVPIDFGNEAAQAAGVVKVFDKVSGGGDESYQRAI